jgi:hypothetical protein
LSQVLVQLRVFFLYRGQVEASFTKLSYTRHNLLSLLLLVLLYLEHVCEPLLHGVLFQLEALVGELVYLADDLTDCNILICLDGGDV